MAVLLLVDPICWSECHACCANPATGQPLVLASLNALWACLIRGQAGLAVPGGTGDAGWATVSAEGEMGASFELSFFNGLRRLYFVRNAALHFGFYGESFQQLAYGTLADWSEPQPSPNKTRESSHVDMELPSLTLNASAAVTRHWWGADIYYPVNFAPTYRLAWVSPLVQSHDFLLISIARSQLSFPPCPVHTGTFAESPGPVGAR